MLPCQKEIHLFFKKENLWHLHQKEIAYKILNDIKDKEEKTLPFKTIIITKIDQKVKNLNNWNKLNKFQNREIHNRLDLRTVKTQIYA